MIRQRNDLSHSVKGQRIFLLAETEAQQREQSFRWRSDGRAFGKQCLACRRRRGNTEPNELPVQKTRRAQQLDRALAFGALDDAVQQRGINSTGTGIVFFELIRGDCQ